jgi:dUTP pyrophosphatase
VDKKTVYIQLEDPSLIPEYGTDLAAGADVKAKITENLIILPGCSACIPTGIRFEIPNGYEIQVRPRSGLALKNQITVLNSPGTVDADYRGELKIILINHGKESFVVTPKMRIAQIVLAPVLQAQFICKEEGLVATKRGEGGFGHTGTH